MKLYGQDRTRREIEERTGRLSQVAGIDKFEYRDGPEDGVCVLQVRTGGGLQYQVTPSRGMDIGLAEFLGTPLAWRSMAGTPHPAYYDARAAEWLRTAAGGLLMTCGLTQVGWPGTVESSGEGLHGRAHHLPASNVGVREEWEGDRLFLRVEGEIRQARLFGENISLRREIVSEAGTSKLQMIDRLRNNGFSPAPLMILYHFNFGFPLITESVKLDFPSQTVQPRDENAPKKGFDQWRAPDPEFQEHVYYHYGLKTKETPTGPVAEVGIEQKDFPYGAGGAVKPVRLALRWNTATLPHFIQWKMCGARAHVLGIEPANCLVTGQDEERERGTLRYLEPGEEITNRLEIEVTEI